MEGDPRGDLELMRHVSAGSREAFAVLVRRHQALLMNFFRRLGVDPHGAEDCAQEVFLRLFRYRDRYTPSAPFAGFLYRLARQAWIDWSRRRRRWERLEGMETMAPDGLSRCEERMDLEEALSWLPDRLSWVVILTVHQGLNQAEVAAVLGIPVGTVKSRMHHAICRLREALDARVES